MCYLTINELCKEISISPATGKNWLKLGKITPDATKNGMPLFLRESVTSLRSDIITGQNTALKNRRNKKYVSGNGIYHSYVSETCKAVKQVQHLVKLISKHNIPLNDSHLQWLLAECALQLILQKENISSSSHALYTYITKKYPLNGFEFLINDLISDKENALIFIDNYPDLFQIEYVYEESEDILGLLYISCKNAGSRKATGSYYTPTAVVQRLIQKLFAYNDMEQKTILDPCCGTGNFLLQLPDSVHAEYVYGSDIDSISVRITRINFALKYQIHNKKFLYNHITERNFLMEQCDKSFDYIIGNPPWGYDFSKETQKLLRKMYRSAAGRNIESYDIFIEQSLSCLKPDGVLSFVLPEAILNVRTHMPIRQLLARETSFRYLEFTGNVFDNVQCPCIILQAVHTMQPISAINMTVTETDRTYVIQTERSISPEYFNFSMTDKEYRILQKIDSVPQKATLKDNAVFALGIVTGDNKKHITDIPSADNEIILKGTDLRRFRYFPSNNFITCQTENFQQSAPMEYYRASEKLLYRFICSQLVFAYDNCQTLSLNSCNILIPKIDGADIKYILAVLNSEIAQFYFTKHFHSIKVLRSHIEQIPIPIIKKRKQADIIQLVDALLVPSSESEIDKTYQLLNLEIANIFHLTKNEYSLIQTSVADENLFLH